ncbi:membrane protein [Beggiatoa sp. PS]|nr:membrane protein [Beggiatoa sp. PS]
MFVTSYDMILEVYHLLMIGAGIVVIFSLFMGRFIVNFPWLFLKIISIVFELGSFSFELLIKLLISVLRLLAIHYVFISILNQLTDYCSDRITLIGFVQYLILAGCVAFIIFSPGEFSTEEFTMMIISGLLVIYKLFVMITEGGIDFSKIRLQRAKASAYYRVRGKDTGFKAHQDSPANRKQLDSSLERAKSFEKRAFRAYKLDQFYDALTQYHKAWDIYRSPNLANRQDLDINRAKLLEKIGVVLYKEEKLYQALTRLNEALDFYKKPHLAKNSALKKERVRVLKESAIVLQKLGRRDEAKQRHQLVSQLVHA